MNRSKSRSNNRHGPSKDRTNTAPTHDQWGPGGPWGQPTYEQGTTGPPIKKEKLVTNTVNTTTNELTAPQHAPQRSTDSCAQRPRTEQTRDNQSGKAPRTQRHPPEKSTAFTKKEVAAMDDTKLIALADKLYIETQQPHTDKAGERATSNSDPHAKIRSRSRCMSPNPRQKRKRHPSPGTPATAQQEAVATSGRSRHSLHTPSHTPILPDSHQPTPNTHITEASEPPASTRASRQSPTAQEERAHQGNKPTTTARVSHDKANKITRQQSAPRGSVRWKSHRDFHC